MKRQQYQKTLVDLLKHSYPVIALLGPRQCGKTTLAREVARSQKRETHFFDLEDPTDLVRLSDPKLALESLSGLVVIDEVQRLPSLFPVLRVLADRRPSKTKFLILGSASPDLIRQSSETLAGRIAYLEMSPFSLFEIPKSNESKSADAEKIWLRGGYPRSFLARSGTESFTWRQNYISTFLERDIPQLGIQIPATQMRRFWLMLCHYHGQSWNGSEIGRSLGVSDTTVRRYLDVLTDTFMIRQLQPWHANIGKRIVKAPKIYLRDSGLFHALLNVKAKAELTTHPKLGASWEGFALETLIRSRKMNSANCFYWGVHGQSELDLFIPDGRRPIGFEVKHSSAPTMTASMTAAIEDLGLSQLYVIYPGKKTFKLSQKVTVITLRDAMSGV